MTEENKMMLVVSSTLVWRLWRAYAGAKTPAQKKKKRFSDKSDQKTVDWSSKTLKAGVEMFTMAFVVDWARCARK
jgi:hypothetical protein